MIEKASGEVKFSGWDISLSPALSRAEFLSSSLAKDAKIDVSNEPYCSWRIKPSLWNDKWWTVVVYFFDQKIQMLTLSAWKDENEPCWENWSEKEEMNRKKYHSRVLFRLLGIPPYRFSWGKVVSIYDEKSASSSIVISYS
jgi:hypothetical protein